MKIFVLQAGEDWFCDRFANEWYKYRQDISTKNPYEADIIWLLPAWQWQKIPIELLRNKLVVATIHHIVPEKFNRNEFLLRDQFVDAYHVPCEKTKELISPYTNRPVYEIGYWYNPALWHPLDKKECRKELGLPDDAFIVGSFQRDTEGYDLKSPKLEKGPDLFCDYLERNRVDNLLVLLNGWRRQYIIKRLEEAGIKYQYEELPSYDIIQKMYASCDMYLVSARYEGGPQAILEAAAMKVPIISTNVGMAVKILPESCIIDITKESYYPTEIDIEKAHINVQKYNIKTHIEEYEKFFRMIGANR